MEEQVIEMQSVIEQHEKVTTQEKNKMFKAQTYRAY